MLVADRIFKEVLDILYKVLKCLIFLPVHKAIFPTFFRKSEYSRVNGCINCFEVFIQQPSHLKMHALTWLNFKQHYMVKVLVEKSPSCCSIFNSDASKVGISERKIAKHSEFLENLKSNGLVPTDQRYLIAKQLALRGASFASNSKIFRGKKSCKDNVRITTITTTMYRSV